MDPIERGIARAGRDRKRFVISGCAWLSLSADRRAAADKMRDMVAYFGPYLEDEALATIGLRHSDFTSIKARIDRGDYAGAGRSSRTTCSGWVLSVRPRK